MFVSLLDLDFFMIFYVYSIIIIIFFVKNHMTFYFDLKHANYFFEIYFQFESLQ